MFLLLCALLILVHVNVFKLASKIPRNAVICVVLLAGLGLLFGLNDQAVATIIAFGTGGLYAMFAMTTGVGLFTRLTGRWNPALGELKLGVWGLVINATAFLWSLFEFINIAWPRAYAVAPDAPWWQLWAVPLVLGSILGTTTLYIVMKSILRERRQKNPLEGVSPV